jgi:hypothetical protein
VTDLPVPAAAEPGQEPAPPPPPVETGNDGVDRALARLGELATLPTEEHGAVYEDVHERLRETLAALDERPGPPPPARPPVPAPTGS